jgi:hypothetical protein
MYETNDACKLKISRYVTLENGNSGEKHGMRTRAEEHNPKKHTRYIILIS